MVPSRTRGFPGCPARLSGHRVDKATDEQEDHIGGSAKPQPREVLVPGRALAGDDSTFGVRPCARLFEDFCPVTHCDREEIDVDVAGERMSAGVHA
jgi:hypothetical protein